MGGVSLFTPVDLFLAAFLYLMVNRHGMEKGTHVFVVVCSYMHQNAWL